MSAARIFSFTFLLISLISFAQQPRLMLPFGHTKEIKMIRFSPDGRMLATKAESENAIMLWEVNTGKLLQIIKGGEIFFNDFDFSPDGKSIVSDWENNTANIWDVYTGKSIRHIKSGIQPHFSGDGKKIVTSPSDQTANISDVKSGKILYTLKGNKGWHFIAAFFTKSGKKVVTLESDSSIRNSSIKIWNAGNGMMENKFSKPQRSINYAISNFAISNDEKKVFIIYENSTVLYNLAENKILFQKEENTNGLGPVSFSPDNKKIIIRSWEFNYVVIRDAISGIELRKFNGKAYTYSSNTIAIAPAGDKIFVPDINGRGLVWDVVNDREYAVLSKTMSEIHSAFFSNDGMKLATTSYDPNIKSYYANIGRVWDTKSGGLLSTFKGYVSTAFSASWQPNGSNAIIGADTVAYLWDTKTGDLIKSYKGEISGYDPQLSPDGKKLLTKSQNNELKIWDIATGVLLGKLVGHKDYLRSYFFNTIGDRILTTSVDKTAKIWNGNTGKLLYELVENIAGIGLACFTPDGKKIVTVSTNGNGKVWDAATGKQLVVFKANDSFSEPYHLSVSSDGNKAILSDFGMARIVDIQSGKIISNYHEVAEDYFDQVLAKFSPDGDRIVTLDRNIMIWDSVFSRSYLTFAGKLNIFHFEFSPDSKKLLTWGEDNVVRVWDAILGKLIFELKGHENIIFSAVYNAEGNRIISVSSDNTFKFWDAVSGKLLYTFFLININGYINIIPSGFYKCSSDAAKLLYYVTKDLKVITFEQLDVKYNRPDKVLEAIGNTDTALIKSYRKAWEKRIKKLGIDTTAFRDGYSVPEADFANRDAIEYEQKIGTLSLQVKGIDSTYKLDRFNVWINEVPVIGQRGINIRKRNKNDFDTTITIKLSQGENRIETSITNVNGTESYRMPLIVNYTPAVKQKETTRFIGIGIDRFADNQYNLQYSSKDIRDLSKKLKEKYGNDIIIDTLFNENVTISNVKALKQKLQQTTENDKVIVAYSGHGMLSKDYDYYLSTYSINFEKPEQNGLPYDELENLLDSIPARKKLMLIDACHSGEVDKEDLVTLNTSPTTLIKGIKPVAYKKDGQLGLKNSFELMQSLFVNVGKSTGATIISAAAGTQFALERGDLKNGVFTYSILEAMNKYPALKISELKKIVGERVEQLTNGLQKPTSRNETIAVDWNVW